MRQFSFLIIFILLISACTTEAPKAVKVQLPNQQVSFFKDVKPVLDNRCVVCHSCYNSPCQAKFSSIEGIDRGASKIRVYNALRLKAQPPTRLFIDARTTPEWRKKGFYSLTRNLSEVNGNYHDSIMLQLLNEKKRHPQIIGDYAPEHDELICPKDKYELGKYLKIKPNHGMPYGFPALQEKDFQTLASWLAQGAEVQADELEQYQSVSKNAQKDIVRWEHFFNQLDPKHQVTARYLYEHLYLAHLYFPTAEGEFFQLVRSYTPVGEKIDIIPTLRPFDDPQTKQFYYRLKKIAATIVHKTHMVVRFDDWMYERLQELFIKPKWPQEAHFISYDPKISANPFIAFEQIPASSRYQFLLDNSRYIVMTFIRGPVCRGQMALNVIQDHFWVFFKDPGYDITVQNRDLIHSQQQNLALPIEKVEKSVMATFSDAYRLRYEKYYKAKKAAVRKQYPNGYSLESIWDGKRVQDAPALTIYRHFDSASVSRGLLGEEPRTIWVIDYAQLERIYYALVAGYDVFGNVSHQTNIRRYMDFLRIEGELNFLEYMPEKQRLAMLKSWYINDRSLDREKYEQLERYSCGIDYKTDRYKTEFVGMLVNQRFNPQLHIGFDKMNYYKKGASLPEGYDTSEDYLRAARALALPGSGFVRVMNDWGANNLFLRIDMPDGSYITKDFVINRWHDNVNSMFKEASTLDASKDTIDILDKFVGSYPNVFMVVPFEELPLFLDLMKNTRGSEADIAKLKSYFISRSNPHFWEYYEWFQNVSDKQKGIEAGLYDLNRYARTPWTD